MTKRLVVLGFIVLAGSYDAKKLLDQAKGTLGLKTAADDDWWKGNIRFK